MKPSILVVDDDQDIAINMADVLNDLGYDAEIANDGGSALKLVQSKAYDVALLDFKMPDMDGAELYAQIKKLQPGVVAIMVTAYAESDGVDRALRAGTWRVLRKPIDFEKLLGFIEEAVH
jgi:DNA-binding NtrC family response regulator